MTNLKNYNDVVFEKIKHIDKDGVEFWYARDLQCLLEYKKWEDFLEVIEKAKEACSNSEFNVLDNFEKTTKIIETDSDATCEIEDIKLTRYACYLIIQNADSSKKTVALCQQYIFTQTRKQEIKERQKDHSATDFSKLAMDLFIATQTSEKLKIEDDENTRLEVTKVVRNTIKELGGTMPEDLPTPTKSIK